MEMEDPKRILRDEDVPCWTWPPINAQNCASHSHTTPFLESRKTYKTPLCPFSAAPRKTRSHSLLQKNRSRGSMFFPRGILEDTLYERTMGASFFRQGTHQSKNVITRGMILLLFKTPSRYTMSSPRCAPFSACLADRSMPFLESDCCFFPNSHFSRPMVHRTGV